MEDKVNVRLGAAAGVVSLILILIGYGVRIRSAKSGASSRKWLTLNVQICWQADFRAAARCSAS